MYEVRILESEYGLEDKTNLITPFDPLSDDPASIYQGAVTTLWFNQWIPGSIVWRVYKDGVEMDIGENY